MGVYEEETRVSSASLIERDEQGREHNRGGDLGVSSASGSHSRASAARKLRLLADALVFSTPISWPEPLGW